MKKNQSNRQSKTVISSFLTLFFLLTISTVSGELGAEVIQGNLNCTNPPVIEWQKSLGGTNSDDANSIQQTTDGGFIIAGSSASDDGDVTVNQGSSDYWIVKTDHLGNIQWQKSYGGSEFDSAYSIQQTSDGGYIVAGVTRSNDGDVMGYLGLRDFWILKLDNLGNLQWQKTLGGSDSEYAQSIQQTTDGGYIVAGRSDSTDGDVTGNHGSYDFWVVKLDNQGTIQWQKSLGGSGVDAAESIQQTTDGGYIVTGQSGSSNGDVSGNHGGRDFWVVKLDNLGTIQWQKSLGGSDGDYGYSIQQTTDGGYIVAGQTNSSNGDVTVNYGTADYWVLKLDNLGTIQWQKTFGGSAFDYGRFIRQTADGGYMVTGWSNSLDGDVTGNHGDWDIWVVYLDPLGNIQWQRSLGGSNKEAAIFMTQTTDGDFIVAGNTLSNNGDVTVNYGSNDLWIVKLSNKINTTVVQNTPVICNGENNGIATVTATGGVPPYTYNWDSAYNGPTANNLNAGTHSVTVTDSNGCQTVNTVSISEPAALSSSVLVTHETLPNANDGSIDLSINGGIAPYTFNWDNGVNTEDLIAIAPGVYCVTITDANGCQEFNCSTVNPGASSLTDPSTIEALTTFELYPNPAYTDATLEISFSDPTDVLLKVVNLLGQDVYAIKKDNLKNSQIEFNLKDYSPGTYLIILETKGQVAVKKMMVLR